MVNNWNDLNRICLSHEFGEDQSTAQTRNFFSLEIYDRIQPKITISFIETQK